MKIWRIVMGKSQVLLLVALQFAWVAGSFAIEIPKSKFDGDGEWSLRRESAGLRILTRNLTDSDLKAVRIETSLAVELSKVVALLTEASRRPEWDEMCKTVTVLSTSENKQRAYFHYDMPWPVADRDMVLQTEVYRVADAVVILSEAVSNDYALKPGRVRVSEAWYRWRLTALSPTKTAVVAEMFMDPAGPIPAWLLNRLALTQPANTVERLNYVLEFEKSLVDE